MPHYEIKNRWTGEEIFNDYTKSVNIAWDRISPDVFVSTAKIPSFIGDSPFGVWFETWIFSEHPRVKTRQRQFLIETEAKRAHENIVRSLSKLFTPPPRGGRRMNQVLSISGGKDSTAMLLEVVKGGTER